MNAVTIGSLLAGVALLAGLALNYLFVPKRASPSLNTSVKQGMLKIGGHARPYLAVIPHDLPPNAPLLLVFHGSMQTGPGIRLASGYAFDQLAVQHGFIVVYPDAYKGAWNDCRTAAQFPSQREKIDDVGLVQALIAHFEASHQIDRSRVYAAGYSNGGQMVFRLAAEAAGEFAGLAAIAATQPTDDNTSCAAPSQPIPMLLIGGTRDPIVPYGGGMISLFGLQPRGTARSFVDTARYYAQLNGQTEPPLDSGQPPVGVLRFAQKDRRPVVAYTIQGGGHVVPGPASAFPGLMGRIERSLDAPAVIWTFFSGLQTTSVSRSEK
ncbi:Polyhydroxybutyrate depolymerase [Deinococcus saxicola]|uniref:alpha/beta hydrolase family esterase n=1 Tax=Deinococcus saxicola TaxID=249406 RepID=UPI0039F02E4E